MGQLLSVIYVIYSKKLAWQELKFKMQKHNIFLFVSLMKLDWNSKMILYLNFKMDPSPKAETSIRVIYISLTFCAQRIFFISWIFNYKILAFFFNLFMNLVFLLWHFLEYVSNFWKSNNFRLQNVPSRF